MSTHPRTPVISAAETALEVEAAEAAANGIGGGVVPGPTANPRRLLFAEAAQGPVLVVLWSSAFVAGVIGTRAGSPLLLCFWRFVLGGLAVGALALVLRSPWPKGRALLHTAVAGVFMHAVQFCGFYYGMGHGLGGGVSALIQGLSPMIVVVLAAATLGERLRAWQWLGFVVGVAGVGIAIADRLTVSPAAVTAAFLGLVGISFATYYQKRYLAGVDVIAGTASQLLVAAPVALLATFVFEQPRVWDLPHYAGALAWIVLVNSMGVFLLLNHMIRTLPASLVSSFFLAVPAVTAVLTWFFTGQVMSRQAVVGLLISGVGAVLASRSKGWAVRRLAPP